jgi:hypothetical protein
MNLEIEWCDRRMVRERHPRAMEYEREAMQQRLGRKIMELTQDGRVYTLRRQTHESPESALYPEAPLSFQPCTVIEGRIFIREAETREVIIARPLYVDEMDWRRLLRTAWQEAAGRLKRKLLFWKK